MNDDRVTDPVNTSTIQKSVWREGPEPDLEMDPGQGMATRDISNHSLLLHLYLMTEDAK